MKYAWITAHRDSFPISVMCDVLLVSTSGYYGSLGRKPGSRVERHRRIQHAVRQVHAVVRQHCIGVLPPQYRHRDNVPAAEISQLAAGLFISMTSASPPDCNHKRRGTAELCRGFLR